MAGREYDNTVECNRISVRDIGTDKIASHYFGMQESIIETGISRMLDKMYSQEFSESKDPQNKFMNGLKDISYNDHRFI